MKYKILLSLFLACSIFSFSQTYNFTQFSEENGLDQAYVYCISQSSEGFLTLSTGEAFCLFDGKKFNTISNKEMVDNIIATHFIDSKNITWLGHQQNGLSYIKNGKYFKFDNKYLVDVKVKQIIEGEDKCIWLATSGGLFTIDSAFKLLPVKFSQARNFNTIFFDPRGSLIAGTDEGLMILSVSPAHDVKLKENIEVLKYRNIKQVVNRIKSDYWVLADGEGIYGLTYKNGRYEVSTHILKELNIGNFNLTGIFSDKSQNLWVSVFGDGLRKLSFKNNHGSEIISIIKIDKSNGLTSQNIQSIFQDTEGNMWFGTFGDGLIKKPVEMFSFYGKKEGLALLDITKVVTDTLNNLWMGTDKGLACLKQQTNAYELYDSKNGFIDDKVNALLMDNQGVLWIGTNANGIFKYYPGTKKFENFSKEKKLNHLSINTIIQTKEKIITGTTDGLYIYNKADGNSEELTTNEGLLHNNVLHLFEDSKNRLWISSHGTPPYYIHNQKITSFKKIKGLNSFNINSVCEDKHGNIWIATEGDGVFKYDDEKFYNYTTARGLLSDYCNGIETDKNNSVWVTHRSGLSELKEYHIKFTAFSNQRGLLFCENNLNAEYRDNDGNLWFGTSQGVMRYNPESDKTGSKIPEIYITRITLNNTTYFPKDVIVKKYGYYIVHIDYHAISLSEPEAISYKYRLLDVDSNWKTTTSPFVDFPKLGDGGYTFEVIACNANNGLCTGVPAFISFKINEPIWKKSWFYILAGSIIIIIFYVIILVRIRNLKKTQALLQFKVDQKTFLLQREKEAVEIIKGELEQKNNDITSSIHYAKNIQDSLLPPEELLKDIFKDNYFVLYKPKDIVSGDFYWCAVPETKNNPALHLAAIIDCTGHGVPGAFLSILANDFLKQSVADKNVNKPNEILDFLNKNLSSHLNQSPAKRKIMDGMDISLIGINYEEKKLYYSGANNPIYIYRNGINGIEEIIIKATKQAIGSSGEKIENYKLEIIDLKAGDTIYLFSDGYADQFGSVNNKKITYKRFRSYLSEAFLMPVSEQKEFLETKLEDWKNGTEQTDDICIMGIKIG